MKYKAIIFDFNGVLLWDTHLHEEVYSGFAKKLRGYPLTKKEMDEHMHGVPNKKVLEYILGKEISIEEAEKLTQEKEGLYRDMCKNISDDEYKLSPGAIELLDFLVKNNIPRTIATSSEQTNVNFFIERFKLEKWFDLEKIVFDDNTFPGKPAPDIYLKAAKNIGVDPQLCVVIEDAKSGILSASAAGIGMVIGIGTEDRHDELSDFEGVDMVIETLEDIKPTELFELRTNI